MADRQIGQTAKLNGRTVVWSGQNYGWQAPATHNKLKEQGKFRIGAQALDRISQSVSRALPQGVKDYVKGVQAEGQRQQDTKARMAASVGIDLNKPTATDRVIDAASKATNVDRRIVGAGASLAQAAIDAKALGRGAARSTASTANRSVGAAAKADVAARTAPATRRLTTPNRDGVVRPSTSRTAATRASSSPGIAKNITNDQATRNAERAAAANKPTQFVNPGRQPTSGGATTGPKREPAGPIYEARRPYGTTTANPYKPRAAASNNTETQTNKRAAVAGSANRAIDHPGKTLPVNRVTHKPRPSGDLDKQKQPTDKAGWNDATKAIARAERESSRNTAYMANGGKRDVAKSEALAKNLRDANKGVSATRTARVSAARQEIAAAKEKVANQTRAYQEANRTRDLEGTTPEARSKMAGSMVNKPHKPKSSPLQPTVSRPKGSNGINANPENGSQRGVRGRVVDGQTIRTGNTPLRNNPRSQVNFDDYRTPNRSIPARPQGPKRTASEIPSSLKGGSVRQPRGGNPVSGFPDRPGRARMTGETSNRTGGSPIKSDAAQKFEPTGGLTTKGNDAIQYKTNNKGRAVASRDARGRIELSPNSSKASSTSTPIRPMDERGSSTPAYRQGTATRDTQRRTDRDGTRSIRRLGESGRSNVDAPELRQRRAEAALADKANKALEELNGGRRATPTPRRLAAAQTRLSELQAEMKRTHGTRKSQPRTQKAIDELKKSIDRHLPTDPHTHRGGEVRIQGNKYSTDPTTGQMVDGTTTRLIGRTKKGGRSAEASAQSQATMKAVRERRAARNRANALKENPNTKVRPGVTKRLKANKPESTVKARPSSYAKGVRNAVDRKGNDLNLIMQQQLKKLGM